MTNVMRAVLALAAIALFTGCAVPPAPDPEARAAAFENDREAILAMTGDYAVTFNFTETVALAEDYDLKPTKLSGGKETVFVIEDTGDRIRLQHVLVVGPEDKPFVVKHWRQDWTYEPAEILSYAGHERWKTVDVAKGDAVGAWAQTVYQVDDSPRYAAVARWEHGADGISTWAAPRAYRPLPRRDATTRDDYNVMDAVNRHTITPWGWVHEQDNEKIVLSEDGASTAVVREVGINSYRAINDFPMAPVTAYWAATEAFWATVRGRWDDLEANAQIIHIAGTEPDDPIYAPVLSIVSDLEAGDLSEDAALAAFEAVLADRVTTDAAIPQLAAVNDDETGQARLAAAY